MGRHQGSHEVIRSCSVLSSHRDIESLICGAPDGTSGAGVLAQMSLGSVLERPYRCGSLLKEGTLWTLQTRS